MEYAVICTAAFIIACLTLLSGFGLGTLLMPAFVIFFPVPIAVALTAIVHLANNLFKLSLFWKFADRSALVHFGLPAVVAAPLGAWVLLRLSDMKPILEYSLFAHPFEILPVKIVIAVLMLGFVIVELPPFQKFTFDRRLLPWGGALSGFFGGISGHQGALRSAVLVKCGLTKESFIATGVAIACLVDISRISVYSTFFQPARWNDHASLLVAATAAAFLGTLLGNRLLKKVTIRVIQILVAVMIFGIALALGLGVI